jgi:hypothetical protein
MRRLHCSESDITRVDHIPEAEMAVLRSNAALPVADCIVRDRYDIRSNRLYIFGHAGGSEELHSTGFSAAYRHRCGRVTIIL